MSSLWLVCLSLIVAANAASLGGRSVNIPVQVVYDTPSRTVEDGPTDSRPVSVKNLDEKLQLSPEEIVEAEVLNIPVTIAKIAAQNIDEDVANAAAEEAINVSSGSSSSDESKEEKSAENSSEEESKEDETNEVNSDKNTLEGISNPVNQEQESVVPADITPPITIVEVPVPDSLVPVMLPVVPDLIPPPLIAPEVVLVPEVQPEGNENNVAELEQQVELVQETNNLKTLLPEIVEQVVIPSETNVSETNNKLVEEAVNEELIKEVTQLKAMQQVDVPPKEIINSEVAVPELYPREQVNVVVQLRATNPEVAAGNEQKQEVQASTTQAPSRPLVGFFNRLGENIGSALNNIRPSTVAAPAPTITTTANTNAEANVNNNSNEASEEAAPPVQAAEVVSAPTTAPPAANILGGLQQNFNSQLNNFGNRFNGFIDNLRPKQPEAVENGEEVTPPNTPILNTVQKQFNNGLQGFSDTVNNALYFINQNNQTNAAQVVEKSPQNDEQPSGQEPPNQFIQAISNGAQQFQQQFTNFVQTFTGQNQQQQQSDEQPPNQPNNATNFGQQVISFFQTGMTSLLQNFNRPSDQSTSPTTQGDENPGAPPPNNNNGGFLGGIQNFASNIGQTFNNFISGGQNASNPAQAIPSQISQAGQQLANATQNLPGAQQIQAGINQFPGAQQFQNLTQQGVEQIQNLQTNIPGAEQIQNLQQNVPGPLQEIIPSGKQIQNNSEEKSPVAGEQNSEQALIAEVAVIPNEEQPLPVAEQIIEAVTQV